jgi:hypothetical protein
VTRLGPALAVAAIGCAASGLACAQEAKPRRHELTAYGAYRVGGEFEDENGEDEFELDESNAYGLVFNFPAMNVDTQWQALWARQQTELETRPGFDASSRLRLDVDYFQFGGTYLFEGNETRPFIALTAGAAHFDPGRGIDSETFFAGSLGGGVQMQKSKRVGVRLEARAFATLVDSDGSLFCRTGPQANVCAVRIEGSAFVQFEASAGIVFRF